MLNLLSLVLIASGLCAFLVFALLREILLAVPRQDQRHLDPPPVVWRLAWPVVGLISLGVQPLMSARSRLAWQRRLILAGVDRSMGPEQFIAGLLLFVALAAALTLAASRSLSLRSLALAAVVALFALLVGLDWLRRRAVLRRLAILRRLPFFIDLVAMCVESGMPLSAALSQSVERSPPGPLRDECARVLRDVKAGRSREEAFRDLARRTDLPAVTNLVLALNAAQRDGGGTLRVLKAQAEQQRTDRLLRAERLAMQAPVKLLFPLVVFIFPGTFAVLLYPVLSRLFAEASR